MSIPVICTVCRTAMKVGEGFTEPKKIRCSGCGTVILLTPEPGNPSNIAVSFPRKKSKRRGLSEGQQRILLYVIFGGFCLFFLYVLWWANKAPDDHGAVEGTVNLDGSPMDDGIIIFESQDGKDIKATISISKGRYSISARNGPGLGHNKVTIHSYQSTGKKVPNPAKPDQEIDERIDMVAPRFNNEERKSVTIQAGSNPLNFDVLSK